MSEDNITIDELITSFFDAFTNLNQAPDLNKIYDLLIPEALIINNTKNDQPEILNIESFITPRAKILCDGGITDFCEKETYSETKIFGNMAQRVSHYKKSGKSDGSSFEGNGLKVFSIIKQAKHWKIASIIWSDETIYN